VVVADYGVKRSDHVAPTTYVSRHAIATKITTIVLKISTRIMIAQIIPGFWMRSKNQCTLENGEEDEEFDKATFTRANVRVAIGGDLKHEPAKRVLQPGVESKGVDTLNMSPI